MENCVHQAAAAAAAAAEFDSSAHKNGEREVGSLVWPRRPNLSSLEIPTRSLENTTSPNSGLPPRPHSARLLSSMKNLIPHKSVRTKNHNGENTLLIIPPSTSRSFSLNKLVFSSTTNSLPETPVPSQDNHSKPDAEQHMKRSFSVPVHVSSRRTDSSGGLIRVISKTVTHSDALVHIPQEPDNGADNAGEDIPEEEAICRICFVELGEESETFKMECSCKGELALAHKNCTLKWFSIKGNKICDVCKQEVRNLPVTLLKIQNPPIAPTRSQTVTQLREMPRYRVWQDVPILVMVSMLAYFCFLEQLLVSDLGARALAISLPFSCVIGLLSAMIASTMVSKSYIWAYASFQFAIVILFAHIFYAVLNVSALLSVLLSSFTGFGIAISTNSLLVEYLRWRASRRLQSSPAQTMQQQTLPLERYYSYIDNPSDQQHHSTQPQQQTPLHNPVIGQSENTGQQDIRIPSA